MFENVVDRLRESNNGKLPFEDQFGKVYDRINRVFEERRMVTDILFMVTYMNSLAIARASRPEIFAATAERKEYAPARAIRKVEFFVKRWGYSYVQSLSIVAERTENEILRTLLNRFANSMESGVPDEDFLDGEISSSMEIFRNSQDSGFELLKKWGDAYIAMLLSAVVIAVTIMISVAIYSPGDVKETLSITYWIIILISLFGIGTMFQTVPTDERVYKSMEWLSKEQGMIARMEKIILPATVAAWLLTWAAGVPAGIIFMLVGIMLAPLGILAYIDNKNVIARDEEFPNFIRGVGSIMGGKGGTMSQALAEIDKKSMAHLSPHMLSVFSKLNLGLNEELSWRKFVGECGSNFIYKYLNIFRDTVNMGGDSKKIGTVVADSMLEQVLMRKKREMISMGFIVLLIPMHAAMAGIFIALYHILVTLSRAITEVMGNFDAASAALSESTVAPLGGVGGGALGIFVDFPEAVVGAYVVNILIIICISNVIVAKLAVGGDRSIAYPFAAIMVFVTGVLFMVIPPVIEVFFSMEGLVSTGGGVI
ncbi:flagellar assembly protein FlaJ [Methanocalculus chunghsingensis]|uniref:Flagellar assembly protein FlaJ n=1 Tax=Methanocalculus chunghsingensis TaxID=156457 RepID=A0A8J8B459_9EURY|nr:archaellar assembly protein FlaJ [Methanocalculus chunghsingensis]MBR1368396.1 flagellar assembly protein FlaJ [Methanocalculus chunghsingensis]